MNLAELLEELRSNVLRDSSGLISGPSDLLWTDETLVKYLNDGQRRFARRTLCLRDGNTPDCCEVTLNEGVINYTLHRSVLAVLSARNEDQTFFIPRGGQTATMGSMQPETEPYGSWSTAVPTAPGLPRIWTTDEQIEAGDTNNLQVIHMTVYPAPSAAEEGKRVFLRVARLPLVNFDVSDLTREPEIPEDYHLDLLEWVAYRAKRNWDVDGEDKKSADNHKARFEQCIAEALQEAKRKVFVPAQWQFGMNGFSHSG